MTPENVPPALTEELTRAATDFFHVGGLAFLLLAVILMAVTSLGILLVITTFAPGLTARASDCIRERPILSFLAGILVICPGLLALKGLEGHPKAQGLVILLYVFLMLIGYAAAAENLGRKLFWVSGRQSTRAAHLTVGWSVYVPAALFPVLGWFILCPWVTLSGLGGLVLAPFRNTVPVQPSGLHTIED